MHGAEVLSLSQNGYGNFYLGQTETPRREEVVGFVFLQVMSRARGLRRVMGTSMDAWIALTFALGSFLEYEDAALSLEFVRLLHLVH